MSKGNFLAEFEIYMMLALSRLGEEAYGVSIRREIEQRTGRPVSIGAVYETLARLGEKDFVSFRISEPLPIPGGRSKKCFRLTPKGESALKHSLSMMARMMEGLDLATGMGGGK